MVGVACIATTLGYVGFVGFNNVAIELTRLPGIRQALDYTRIRKDSYKHKTSGEVKQEVDTWNEARDYLMGHFSYSSANKGYPLEYSGKIKELHEAAKANCSAGADLSCMLLNRSPKYEARRVHLSLRKGIPKIKPFLSDHAVALIYDKQTGKYGSLGINSVDCIPPTHEKPEEVLRKVNTSFLWMFDLEKNDKAFHTKEPGFAYGVPIREKD